MTREGTDLTVISYSRMAAVALDVANRMQEENGLSIRVYGTDRGLSWEQENPNYLILKDPKGFKTVYSKGGEVLSMESRQASFLPVGHPDGYIEAFANIYREGYRAIRADIEGKGMPACDFPTVDDGVESMVFVETVLESSRSSAKWTKMKRPKG